MALGETPRRVEPVWGYHDALARGEDTPKNGRHGRHTGRKEHGWSPFQCTEGLFIGGPCRVMKPPIGQRRTGGGASGMKGASKGLPGAEGRALAGWGATSPGDTRCPKPRPGPS